MRFAVATKNNGAYLFFFLLSFAVSSLGVISIARPASAQSTMVGATVCSANGSAITLTNPISDSVVTDGTVAISGTVSQASQIEIRIDDAFDSIIPIAVGQTDYSGSVQMTAGTHTIKVTALNMCAGPNGTASAVVTYTLPPQAPSTGTGTPTTVEGVMPAVEDGDKHETINDLGPLDRILQPLEGFAAWLNIDTGSQTDHVGSLSVGRALTITVGMYLLVLGLAPPVLMWASTLPVIAQALPALPAAGRIRLLGRVGRVIGLLLMLGAFFL